MTQTHACTQTHAHARTQELQTQREQLEESRDSREPTVTIEEVPAGDDKRVDQSPGTPDQPAGGDARSGTNNAIDSGVVQNATPDGTATFMGQPLEWLPAEG